jgi:hypothetical protein
MARKLMKAIPAQEIAGLVVGAAVGAKVANLNITAIPEKLKPVLPLVLGIFLMKKKGFMASIGQGMVAVGATKTLGAFVPNLGIGASEGISEYTIEGANDYALAGMEIEGMNEGINGASSYALAGVDSFNSDLIG